MEARSTRGIDASQGNLIAEAEGEIEVEQKVVVIKQMRVRHMLKGFVPLDKWEATERAHAVHALAVSSRPARSTPS